MVYRECRNTVNHKIVPDEPLGSLTGLAPIRNALFPPFLPSWRPEITFRVRDRGWKSVFYVIPFMSLTLVYTSKGAPLNSLSLSLFPLSFLSFSLETFFFPPGSVSLETCVKPWQSWPYSWQWFLFLFIDGGWLVVPEYYDRIIEDLRASASKTNCSVFFRW